jgi:serine/threonine protein kinase
MARFRREIDVLRELDHPHVMPIIEADPAARWYAMPIAEYTLRQLHDRDPLAWEALREALSSVCGAMLHMHAHGLVHRDASPGNVLCLQDGHWVLADYGLVRRPPGVSDSLTRTGMRFGTPRFSAPEVHHDPRTATSAADAYSLGALASWFTLIPPDREVSSAAGLYWSDLIRNTVLFDPRDRWSVSRVGGIASTVRFPAAV